MDRGILQAIGGGREEARDGLDRAGNALDVEPHVAVGVARDEERLLTLLGVQRKCSVREAVSVGFIDHRDDTARSVDEAERQRRAERHVGSDCDRTVGGDRQARAFVNFPTAEGFGCALERVRARQRGRPVPSLQTSRGCAAERATCGLVRQCIGPAPLQQSREARARRLAKAHSQSGGRSLGLVVTGLVGRAIAGGRSLRRRRDDDAAEVGGAQTEGRTQRREDSRFRLGEGSVGETDACDLFDEALFALRIQSLGQGREVIAEARRVERFEIVGEPGVVVALGSSPAGRVDRGGSCRSAGMVTGHEHRRRRHAHCAAQVLAEHGRRGRLEDRGREHGVAGRALHLFAEGLARGEDRDEEEREPPADLLEDVRTVGAAMRAEELARRQCLGAGSESPDQNHERTVLRSVRQYSVVVRGVWVVVVAALIAGCSHPSHPSPASFDRVPEVPRGSAEAVAGVSTSQQPCTGTGYAHDQTGQCFHILGAPIFRASDVASVEVFAVQPFWEVFVQLNADAAARLDRFAATRAERELVVVSGSEVISAGALPVEPLHGSFSFGNMTENDARHTAAALQGPKTGDRPIIHGNGPNGPTVTPVDPKN
jgi:hypothetical protein